jgi:hypothetical protein
MLIDKFSSKPNVSKTPSQVAVENATVKASKAKDAAPVVSKKAPPVVTPPLTDKQIQAELDRVKASEEAFTPPEGAIKNADGTYSVVEDGMKITYNADGTTAGMESAADTTTGAETQYFKDEDGNLYTMSEGGSYDLAFYADGSPVETVDVDDELFGGVDTEVAENTWTDPDTGEVWNMGEGGMWTLEGDDSTYYDDSLYADNAENIDDSEYLYAGNDDDTNYYDYDYAKRGGLITMMNKGGGVRHFAEGGDSMYSDTEEEVQDWQNLSDNPLSNSSAAVLVYGPDGTAYANPYSAQRAGVFDYTYTPPGSEEDVFQDAGYSDANGAMVQNEDGSYTYKTWAQLDEIAGVPAGTTYGGGDTRPWYDNLGSKLGTAIKDFTGMSQGTLDKITGALPAAGAGALVASLLGSDFGGSENQNQGLDMSKVGLINPRTTDFGIGPTRFVGYEDYGTGGGDYTPNEELLRNLNAPGYNPVNEGDYGYEEVPAEAPAEAPKMASGGLSSMATPVSSYYTFGQPADILANLGMRAQPPMTPPEMMPQIGQQQQPQQTQQQGLPQQAPPQMAQQMPQGMPQQGMMPQQQGMPPPMRKGGLPHVSNVPMVEGRMDFRQGSAVHGEGDGQSDDIPAMLADGEYVFDADTVAQIGNGSTKAGAQALDKFRESIRAHKRSAPVDKIPPKTKALTSYLKGAR